MTPAARVAAAIGILDEVIEGRPAERCLTRWARASRFAGSRDRAAIRDLVFDVLRMRRSALWRSGAEQETGRALLIGLLASRAEPEGLALFDGSGYGPAALSAEERAALRPIKGAPAPVRFDIPEAAFPFLSAALGDDLARTATCLQSRAPVHLRVNTVRAGLRDAIAALGAEEITAEPIPDVPTALNVLQNARRLAGSAAYQGGLVELQDAASQAAALAAEARPGETVLDYCAGGGGKALALGASMGGEGRIFAHDVNPARMKDIPARAARAGLAIGCRRPGEMADLEGSCDLVFVDAPCSGTGAWRRQPEAKWAFSAARLAELTGLQADILTRARRYLRPGGRLVYATCSLLREENEDQLNTALARETSLRLVRKSRFSVAKPGDGFYFALFQSL